MRQTEKHLSVEELAGLIESQRSGVEKHTEREALDDARRHLESCSSCQSLVSVHKEADRRLVQLKGAAVGPTRECPPEAALRELAVGTMAPNAGEELLSHVSSCDHCGTLFKNAVEAFEDTATPEEQGWLGSLKSSGTDWQSGLGRELHHRSRGMNTGEKSKLSFWTKPRFWPRLGFSAAAVLLVGLVAYWLTISGTSRQVESLIAEAYTQQRTLELRIPMARYAPVRTARGTNASRLDRPAPLLEAEALIARRLAARPGDPIWLAARARADLLDGNYGAALEELQSALRAKPRDPALLGDLATAHFERAEAESLALEYGKTVELLSEVLVQRPDDRVALFNRAIACDRLFLYQQEIVDWEHYLRLDRSGGWAEEAKRRLEEARNKVKSSRAGPVAILAARAAAEYLEPRSELPAPTTEATSESSDALDEGYLELAVTEWLTDSARRSVPEVQRAATADLGRTLHLLGLVLKRQHGDSWVGDVVLIPQSKALSQGFVSLARAVKANAFGDPGTGEEESRRATEDFQRAGALPAVVRAKLETVYSLHRAQRPEPCLEQGLALLPETVRHGYPWIRAQLLLEIASCYSMLEKLDLAAATALEASAVAELAHYGALELRSIGIRATVETNKGNFARAWSLDLEGLAKYWNGSYPRLRGYQFYSDLGAYPEQGAEKQLALLLARQAVSEIAEGPHRAFEAMARYHLASLSADKDETSEQYQLASQLFAELPQTSATRVYHMSSELALAEIEAAGQDYAAALPRLERIRSDVPSVSNQTVSLRYYLVTGRILLEAQAPSKAEEALRTAVQIATRKLESLGDDRDRLAWEADAGAAAKLLTYLLLRRKQDSIGALAVWESYRLLPFTGGSGGGKALADHSSSAISGVGSASPVSSTRMTSLAALSAQSVVSYAVFPSGTAIWVFDNRGINSAWVDVGSDELEAVSAKFTDLCASRSSDLAELQRLGRQLYGWLVAPIRPHLQLGRTLAIEADGPVITVPMQALLGPSGAYFTEEFRLISSPHFCFGANCRSAYRFSASQRALVVGAPALGNGSTAELAPLPDAVREATHIASLFRDPKVLRGEEATIEEVKRELPRSDVFHFAGHALVSGRRKGLLLAAGQAGSTGGKTEDALLDGDELQGLDLRRCQLVVLSACSTGIEQSDGKTDPDGLLRSLFRAGVPRVLATRWSVDSETTAGFMEQFYASLVSQEGFEEALRTASAKVRRQPQTAHPYFWAAFNGFGLQ